MQHTFSEFTSVKKDGDYFICSSSWSADDRYIAFTTDDGWIVVWDNEACEKVVCEQWESQSRVVSSTWCPDGTLYCFDATGTLLRVTIPTSETPFSIQAESLRQSIQLADCHPEFDLLALKDDRSHLIFFQPGKMLHQISDRWIDAEISDLKWSRDGSMLAMSSYQGDLLVYDVKFQATHVQLEQRQLWPGNGSRISSIDWSPDHNTIVGISRDNEINLWTLGHSQRETLRGHNGKGLRVSFSCDGRYLISTATNGPSVIWEYLTGGSETGQGWQNVSVQLDPYDRVQGTARNTGACFSRTHRGKYLTLGNNCSEIRIREHSPDDLSRLILSTTGNMFSYVFAKVVVLGNQHVGKTALVTRLAGRDFVATESTHALNVEEIDSESPITRVDVKIRVWDLAGQYGYRLSNRLHLADADVAIIVFDSQSESDPWAAVEYWREAISLACRTAKRQTPPVTFLVASKCENGKDVLSQKEIAARMKSDEGRFEFAGYFETCARYDAMDNAQTAKLRKAVCDAVNDAVASRTLKPITVSRSLFQQLKEFLEEERLRASIVDTDEIREKFINDEMCDAPNDRVKAFREEFESYIKDLESLGMLRRFKVHSNKILLSVEYFDYYASALVLAARSRSVSSLSSDDIFSSMFRPMDAFCVKDASNEIFLYEEIVDELVGRELVFFEKIGDEEHLVFPIASPSATDFSVRKFEEAGAVPLARFDVGEQADVVYSRLMVRLLNSGRYQLAQDDKIWGGGGAASARNFTALSLVKSSSPCVSVSLDMSDPKSPYVLIHGLPSDENTLTEFKIFATRIVDEISRNEDRETSQCPIHFCSKCKRLLDANISSYLELTKMLPRCPECNEAISNGFNESADKYRPEDHETVSVWENAAKASVRIETLIRRDRAYYSRVLPELLENQPVGSVPCLVNIKLIPEATIPSSPSSGMHGRLGEEINEWIANHSSEDEPCAVYRGRAVWRHENNEYLAYFFLDVNVAMTFVHFCLRNVRDCRWSACALVSLLESERVCNSNASGAGTRYLESVIGHGWKWCEYEWHEREAKAWPSSLLYIHGDELLIESVESLKSLENRYERSVDNFPDAPSLTATTFRVVPEFVFVSYTKQHKDLVCGVREYLEHRGVYAWTFGEDQHAGDKFFDRIQREIDAVSDVVVIPEANGELGKIQIKELNYAISNEKRILVFQTGAARLENDFRFGDINLSYENTAEGIGREILKAISKKRIPGK